MTLRLALAFLAVPAIAQAQPVAVTYLCERGVELPAVYVNEGDGPGHVVAVIEGHLLLLPQAISASGARYRAEGEGYELWSKGDSVTVSYGGEDDSQILLRDCAARDAG